MKTLHHWFLQNVQPLSPKEFFNKDNNEHKHSSTLLKSSDIECTITKVNYSKNILSLEVEKKQWKYEPNAVST